MSLKANEALTGNWFYVGSQAASVKVALKDGKA